MVIKLINQIRDSKRRQGTLIMAIYNVSRTDRNRALQLLKDHGLEDNDNAIGLINQ